MERLKKLLEQVETSATITFSNVGSKVQTLQNMFHMDVLHIDKHMDTAEVDIDTSDKGDFEKAVKKLGGEIIFH